MVGMSGVFVAVTSGYSSGVAVAVGRIGVLVTVAVG